MVKNQQRNKASSSTASVAAAQKAKKKVGFRAGKGGPENPKCQYRGVRQRTWGKWVAELRIPGGQREWLGSYATAEAAAKAYDEATIKYRGLSGATKLNFPENYPITRSRSCKDSTSTDHHKSEKKDSNSKDQDLACSSLTSQSSRKKDSNSSSSNAAAASGGCTEPVLLFGANIAAGGVEETSPHLISNRPLNKLEASR